MAPSWTCRLCDSQLADEVSLMQHINDHIKGYSKRRGNKRQKTRTVIQ